MEGVPQLTGHVTKCDAPNLTPGRRTPQAAADDDLPSITFICSSSSRVLTEEQIVIKLRSLKANTPVVANPGNKTLQFTLAAALSVTVASSQTVATTTTLTLHLSPAGNSKAFETLSRWLDACGHHYGVGGTDVGGYAPTPSPPRRMRALESPSAAARASPAAVPAEVVVDSPPAAGLTDLERRLVVLDQTDFDEMLIRVLQLRIQRRVASQ